MGRQLADDEIRQIAREEGTDPDLVLAIIKKENSKFSDVSGAGAVGQGQLLPATFKSVLPNGDITKPEDNIRAAARYIKQGYDKTQDVGQTAMFYYGGPSFDRKTKSAPNRKYGTNPDGTGGISLEDYRDQTVRNYESLTGTSTGLDYNAIDSEIGKLGKQAETTFGKAIDSQATLSDTLTANVKEQMKTVEGIGELQATAALDAYRMQSTKASEAAADLSRRGINLSDIDSIVAEAATANAEDYKVAQAMREQIDAKRTTSLLDNPVEWLINRFTLPGEISKHNAIIQQMDARKQYVDDASATASHVQASNAAKYTAMSAEGAQAAAQVLRDTAHLKSLELQDRMLKTDFDTQVRTMQMIDARMRVLSTMESRETNAGIRRDAAQKKVAEDEQRQLMDQRVNIAGKVLGLDVLGVKELAKLPKATKEAVSLIAENNGTIGEEPLKTLQILRQGNSVRMPPTTKFQYDMLTKAYVVASQHLEADPMMKGETDRTKQMTYLNNEMTKLLDGQARDPNTRISGMTENPYKVPPIEVMRELPALKNNRLPTLVDNFRKQFPNTELTDSLIGELALAQVGKKDGYNNLTEAAQQTSEYFREGAKYNNQKMRFDSYGLKTQETYMVGPTDYSSYAAVMKKFLSGYGGPKTPSLDSAKRSQIADLSDHGIPGQ